MNYTFKARYFLITQSLEGTKRGALILDPFRKSLYDLSYSHFSYLLILNVFGCLYSALQISRST